VRRASARAPHYYGTLIIPGRLGRRMAPSSPRVTSSRPPRPSPAVDIGASDLLWDQLAECHRRIRAELRTVVLRHGIYLSEYRGLARLRYGSRSLSQLADSLGLTPASMTDLASQLVDRHWAQRRPHPTDRRSQLLEITSLGRRTFLSTRREYRARLAEVYETLPSRTREALGEGLHRLSHVLEDRVRAGRTPGRPLDLPGSTTARTGLGRSAGGRR
jgi:DNA-binding MarR family transcriptional regulator